jgi:hypothetical protein
MLEVFYREWKSLFEAWYLPLLLACMQDYENIAAIQIAADHWASQGKDVPEGYRAKVVTVLSANALGMYCSFVHV